jgi:hypothetical protein
MKRSMGVRPSRFFIIRANTCFERSTPKLSIASELLFIRLFVVTRAADFIIQFECLCTQATFVAIWFPDWLRLGLVRIVECMMRRRGSVNCFEWNFAIGLISSCHLAMLSHSEDDGPLTEPLYELEDIPDLSAFHVDSMIWAHGRIRVGTNAEASFLYHCS